jgi:hypothetical protein
MPRALCVLIAWPKRMFFLLPVEAGIMTRGREEFAIDTSGRERHGSATWTKQP